MIGVQVRTQRGSTYLIGPSPRAGDLRLARISDHVVGGTLGPVSFAEDVARIEFVTDGTALRLRCTADDGTRFETSAIVAVDETSVAADVA